MKKRYFKQSKGIFQYVFVKLILKKNHVYLLL
jgi:hypothetical protein